MSNLSCWNCDADASDEPLPLSRQASCQQCGEYLHTCRQCTQYDAGKPQSCVNDLADPPSDKTSANFCEYFIPNMQLSGSDSKNDNAKAKLDALFGDENEDSPQSSNPLDDLFND